MSITNGMLSIVVSGAFTLALVTNHNGMYLINTPCNAKVLSRNMLDVITCILAYYGLMLISASISNGRLIVVCAKDASIPPPLAQVAVVYVCEVLPTPVVSTLMTVSLVKAMALNVPLLVNGAVVKVSTGDDKVVCMHPFWFLNAMALAYHACLGMQNYIYTLYR